MDLSGLGEFGFVERVRTRLRSQEIGDDAAVLGVTPGRRLVATTDLVVEGVHFRPGWSSPADVGWKAAAVNVSDLAAMGAEPRWLLVGLGAPSDTPTHVLDGLYEGLDEACTRYGMHVVGGDTVESEHVLLAVTALGEVEGGAMTRSGASVGDVLAVTGPLGAATTGVKVLSSGTGPSSADEQACVTAHRRPQARVEEGLALVGRVHACIDLSDGLLSDVRRLAEASGVGVEVDADTVPVAEPAARVAAARGFAAAELALGGGEDLELLVSVDPHALPVEGVPLIPVGRVVAEGLWLVSGVRREPLPLGGWKHFA